MLVIRNKQNFQEMISVSIIESFGSIDLVRNDDGTFSASGTVIKDYGGRAYTGGDIVAADSFNGSTAVLFSSGHLWYVDGSWTKAGTGPGGRDTENLSPSEMDTYFFSDAPPSSYGSDEPVAPAPVPIPAPVPLGEFGRHGSVAEAIAYGVANGQGPLAVQPNGAITNASGQIMVYDSDGNLAPSGDFFPGFDDGLTPEPAPAPITPDPSPVVPDPDPIDGGAYSSSGFAVESSGDRTLFQMSDGTYRVDSVSGELIKDYGGSVWQWGTILAANTFNGSNAVLFEGGHVWYVDSSWTKAPVGPSGRDTENLSPSEIDTYFFSDAPPATYGSDEPLAPEPAPIPTPVPVGEFGRHSSVAEAIAYGVANGQGPLAVQSNGAITNASGQVMVYDSDGNLAPSGEYFPGFEDGITLDPDPADPPSGDVPGSDREYSSTGREVESFGDRTLYRMSDGTYRVDSLAGELIKDYGGSVWQGGTILAANTFNGSNAVLFEGGHVWYVDSSWTKAPVGPGGRDTENLLAREISTYFYSETPPASYESDDNPVPVTPPVETPPADNDQPAISGFELESFGSYSLYRMDDNTFRIDSPFGPRIRDYGGSVYRGGDVVAVDNFNGGKAVLFGSGHLWYVDSDWTKAGVGPNGRDAENLSVTDMSTYFYSDAPPNAYDPVEDEKPRLPVDGAPGEPRDYSSAGVLVEGFGNYSLYSMTDGTYRVGALDGSLIKDYGGTVWRGGSIIAADDFNGAKAIVFEGGHVWYVNDSWTKAPVGPNGNDTEQLGFSAVNNYFYSDTPPIDYGNPVIDQPIDQPNDREYSSAGKIAESFGDWPLFKMDDGTYRVGSLDGPLIKDYGGSVWQGGTIVAADKFNGALAVVFEGGHLWYVNSNWTKAQLGPQGRDTENLTISQLANYFYSDNPPLFYDNDEFVTSPPAPEPPVDGGSPETTGTVIESFGSYSLYRMGDGTYRVNSLVGEQVKDAGGQVWTGGGVVAVDDVNGVRTIAFADGNVWYADASWTKANVGPEGKSADAFSDEEISEYFFDGGSSVVEPEEPDEIIPPAAGLDPAEFNYLYSSPTGKELVNRLIAVGIERILANVSLEQVERIFEKFGTDIDFLDFAETPDAPQVEFESEMWTLSLLPTGVYQVEPAGGGPISIISNSNGSPTLDSVVAVTTSNFVNMIAFEGGRVWYADSNWMRAPLGPNGISSATFSTDDINAVFFGENKPSDTPSLEKPIEDEKDEINEPPTEDIPDAPIEDPADDLPLEENPVDEPVEPGSGLPQEEFLFFFESETGLEIVTKIQEADLDRLSFLISDEQVAQIFAKFSEDPDWLAFVASIQGGDRTASELTVGEKIEAVYEIELVGTTSESYPDYLI